MLQGRRTAEVAPLVDDEDRILVGDLKDKLKVAEKAREAAQHAFSACARPNSFVPGTLVLMADGTHKPIEQVKTGDKVLATDPDTGKTKAKPVIALITGEGAKNLVQITVDTDGTKGNKTGAIIATDTHPFWVTNLRTWVPATRLTPGAWLRTSTGTHLQITAITKRTVNNQQVHNLTIADIHTYYVAVGEVDVLVHDAGCWSTAYENASDLAKKYKEGQSTRDPASQWYHEELSNKELPDAINNAADGDGIVVSRNGRILGGHHRWDELLRRIKGGRIDPKTRVRIDVYGGE
ncbi:polymorphic toxin-type HINT domain-containing protein [Streptosporangium sp. NPDC004631]